MMAADPDEPTWATTKGLDERVLAALESLPGRIPFSGLRRTLRAHPESLSRSLRRLEREGQVERSREGYRAVRARRETDGGLFDGLRAIAQVELPPGTLSDTIFARISGRWFGSLRWAGVVEGPRGRLLAWTRRDGTGPVLLGIQRGTLRVYVRDDGSSDEEEAEDVAYELLTHAVGALRSSPPTVVDRVNLLASTPIAPTTWTDN